MRFLTGLSAPQTAAGCTGRKTIKMLQDAALDAKAKHCVCCCVAGDAGWVVQGACRQLYCLIGRQLAAKWILFTKSHFCQLSDSYPFPHTQPPTAGFPIAFAFAFRLRFRSCFSSCFFFFLCCLALRYVTSQNARRWASNIYIGKQNSSKLA